MSEESLQRELERYRKRYSELEAKNAELEKQMLKLASENRELREKLSSLETTVSAVVARSIGAKADTGRRRFKKSGRREGPRARAGAGPTGWTRP